MAKRIRKLKEEDAPPKKMLDLDPAERKLGKRLSRGNCACRTGGCKSCICTRDKRSCTKECGCSASGVCKNAATEHVLVIIYILFILMLKYNKNPFSQKQEDANQTNIQDDKNRMLNETFDLGRKRSQPSSKENSM